MAAAATGTWAGAFALVRIALGGMTGRVADQRSESMASVPQAATASTAVLGSLGAGTMVTAQGCLVAGSTTQVPQTPMHSGQPGHTGHVGDRGQGQQVLAVQRSVLAQAGRMLTCHTQASSCACSRCCSPSSVR